MGTVQGYIYPRGESNLESELETGDILRVGEGSRSMSHS